MFLNIMNSGVNEVFVNPKEEEFVLDLISTFAEVHENQAALTVVKILCGLSCLLYPIQQNFTDALFATTVLFFRHLVSEFWSDLNLVGHSQLVY